MKAIKNKWYVLVFVAVVGMGGGMAYTYAGWQPVWNDTGFIRTGGVIPAQQIGENFEYLKKQIEDFENCSFERVDDVACKFTYNCRCGKYGCSTCTIDSTRSDLIISCPDADDITFEGACRDPRQPRRCGKYGCR